MGMLSRIPTQWLLLFYLSATNQSINTCQDESFPLSLKACIETGYKS